MIYLTFIPGDKKANVCVRAICTAGFYNPDGKSCGITASLSLMQYIKPFMELVASRKGEIGKNLYEVKMFSTSAFFVSLTQRTLFSCLNKFFFLSKGQTDSRRRRSNSVRSRQKLDGRTNK